MTDDTRFAVLPAETLCETLDVRAGEHTLDVASGTGSTALATARRFCNVTATDVAPDLLEHLARRAAAEDLEIDTRVADCQALPFDDETFDVVTSTFGAMFAPDHQTVADELLRVCRRGGRIGMNNWSPKSIDGDMCRAIRTVVPPPTGARPPVDWGSETRLRELFGDRISSLRIHVRDVVWRFYSAEHMLENLRGWHGPTISAFDALEPHGQEALAEVLCAVFRNYDRSSDDTLVAPSDYVQVVAVRA